VSSSTSGSEGSGRARTSQRQVVALATLGAGAGGALGACSPASGSGAPPATTGSGQPARVVWLNWEGGGASLEGNTKTIESFQAQHQRITVENAAQTTAGVTYWDKHAAMKASGTAPDLWEWEPQNVVDYVLRKQVLDLQPLVARDRHDLSDFFPRASTNTATVTGCGASRATSPTAS
jgi:ABC-type glycerol-3-phosphate transport system substrate-binding protein